MQKKLSTYDVFLYSILVGCVATIFLLFFLLFFHTFHFITFHPFSITEQIIIKDHWFIRILYYSCLFIVYCICCVVLSLIYFLFWLKRKELQIGVVYGICLWAIFYILFPYLFVDKLYIMHLPMKMTVTMFCLSVLYGCFVGYPIFFYDQIVSFSLSTYYLTQSFSFD